MAGFAVLLLLLQALVPAGFMPSFAKGGKVALTICSEYGEKTVLIDAPDDGRSQQHPDDGVCPYFVASHSATLTASMAVPPPPTFLVLDFTEVKDQAAVSHYNPSHAPRGPPESV